MSENRKLTPEEVAALVEGVGDSDDRNTETKTGDRIQEFDFGSDEISVLGDYYALRVINEKLSRLMRAVYQPMLRVQPRVTSMAPKIMRFVDYCSNVDAYMSLTTFRMEELRGNLLIVLSPNFISLLTSSYYGGNIRMASKTRSEFTATEERVIEIVTEGMGLNLKKAWRDLVPINLQSVGREENVQFATFVEANDNVLVCSFNVQLPEVQSETIDILYPVQTLKPIASQLRSRVQAEVIDDDLSWKEKFENAILNIPLVFKARIAQPRISMGRLISMKGSETISIDAPRNLRIFVEELNLWEADLGEMDGKRAIILGKELKNGSSNE